jgi:NAD(P)-dependent dehydrogenase (short-subunit alcohol dehydrogenase family)
MTSLLEDKIVAVTGAASGIGQATAILAAREGAAGVVVTDRNQDGLEQTVAELQAHDVAVASLVASIDAPDTPEKFVALAIEHFGRLDAAINNAGVRGRLATVDEVDDELWEEVIGINLRSVMRSMLAQLRQMYKQADGGSIVNVASAAVFGVPARLSPYVVSKAGVVWLTKVAAVEAGPQGVRVNVVCPGRTDTPLFNAYAGGDGPSRQGQVAEIPLGRTGRPQEPAEALVWLASPRSSFVTGEVLIVDGGRTLS